MTLPVPSLSDSQNVRSLCLWILGSARFAVLAFFSTCPTIVLSSPRKPASSSMRTVSKTRFSKISSEPFFFRRWNFLYSSFGFSALGSVRSRRRQLERADSDVSVRPNHLSRGDGSYRILFDKAGLFFGVHIVGWISALLSRTDRRSSAFFEFLDRFRRHFRCARTSLGFWLDRSRRPNFLRSVDAVDGLRPFLSDTARTYISSTQKRFSSLSDPLRRVFRTVPRGSGPLPIFNCCQPVFFMRVLGKE